MAYDEAEQQLLECFTQVLSLPDAEKALFIFELQRLIAEEFGGGEAPH